MENLTKCLHMHRIVRRIPYVSIAMSVLGATSAVACNPSCTRALYAPVPHSTEAPMSRSIALNALFIVAGCTSAAVETILYRLALIMIVLLLRAWWARSVVKRTARDAIRIYRQGHPEAARRVRASAQTPLDTVSAARQ